MASLFEFHFTFEKASMSSNKDFLPSSSPMTSICAIEIEAILLLFMMNCYKSSFRERITTIVLIIGRTRNQPPYCLYQLQEKIAFRLPRSGCLGTPLTLPQSLYGRTDAWTDVRWRQNQNFSDEWVTKFAYPWCSASSAKNTGFLEEIWEPRFTRFCKFLLEYVFNCAKPAIPDL